MIDFVRWLLAVEIVGLACLPLSVWFLRRLPDRGYIFAKLLGLLLVTYVTWLAGLFLPLAASPLVPALAIIVLGAGGWWLWRVETMAALRRVARIVLGQEVLFILALAAWSLLRAFVLHPAINHTEQFMDMSFLNASLRSASYPPYDPWMSGHTINYYYFGYLMYATLIKLAGVPAVVGYNLALSFLFAFTVAGAYSLGYALTRHVAWAGLAPMFVALLGNWHAILVQIPQHHLPGNTQWWFWESTRVVDPQNTINEFPLFSFILGDLHPHVMALPVALLAIACGASILLSADGLRLTREGDSLGRLILLAVCLGSLYTINSWDFPTYLLVVSACLVAASYITDLTPAWWKGPAQTVPVLACCSVVAFLPFYLRFKNLAHGIGPVTTRTDPLQFLQVFGFFFLACGLLVLALGLLLRPAEGSEEAIEPENGEEVRPTAGLLSERGTGGQGWVLTIAIVALAVLVIVYHGWTLLLILALGAGALAMLQRVVNTEEPNRPDALALILVVSACLVLALTEIIYVRDAFDGGVSYRMNTVFKFYYQAWLLLGLAGAYGAFRSWRVLGRIVDARLAWATVCLLALGALGGGVYTVFAPSTAIIDDGVQSLDGMAWIQHTFPGDYGVIRWFQRHVSGNPVELEAIGGGYTDYGLISTFSGLPTVMGWADHEGQWRPGDPDVEVRVNDVRTIYTTANPAVAEKLLRKYNVGYFVVGEHERSAYGSSPAGLTKFATFMKTVYSDQGATIYAW